MTNKQARHKCVNHWKRMLKLSVEDIRNEKEHPGPDNCAFCKMYRRFIGVPTVLMTVCDGCPIKEKTGKNGCLGTPHGKAAEIYESIELGESKAIKTFYKAVEKEIKFLESLDV